MKEEPKVMTEDTAKEIQKLNPADACASLGSTLRGLSDEQVAANTEKYGKNVLVKPKGKPIFLVFIENFTSLMAIMLWIGGGIALFTGTPELAYAIWMVNVLNGLFSFWQEFRAGKATEALKNMLPANARVIRNGNEVQILAEDLVPGDVMIIEEGDKISADARLISASDMQVNQSTLTGESNPIRKTQDPILEDGLTKFEMANLIFEGTSVSSGTGRAVVTATGMNTEFGHIASLAQDVKEEQSPLQKELDILTRQITTISSVVAITFLVLALLIVHQPFAQAFILALGMFVAFIPEGLLPTVTLSLAMAVQRMATEHALVKRLSAVETLGCTSVICSDKTGTLTQNEMTVTHLYLPGREMEVTGLGYAPEGEIRDGGAVVKADEDYDLKTLLVAAAFCSNARVLPPDEQSDRYTVLGDPTEACLGVAAQKAGIHIQQELDITPRLRELPFDSTRKRMSTIHNLARPVNGKNRIAYIKGAPKETLDLCVNMMKDGELVELSDAMRAEIMATNDHYATMGLRVLAVAVRRLGSDDNLPDELRDYTPEIIEKNLSFVGLVAMMDPPRPEVAAAVAECHQASIRIIMITGDYGLTAESIAKKIGIVTSEHPNIITGTQLKEMPDEELKEALKQEVIFARMAPEQKYRVVSALQENGEIVAVTGDGVNDAPALKKADIGVAMGITGTDVAKEAAEMILTDDNFASIVKAIREGRAVYRNIRKFLLYIFNSNTPEAVPSAAFLLSAGRIPLPLTVMQILSIDLGTDMVPALGLGAELPEDGIMDIPPRSRSERLLNKHTVLLAFGWYGMMESLLSLGGYFLANFLRGWPASASLAASGTVYSQATTMALASIVFCQIGVVLCARTERTSVFKNSIRNNRTILIGIVLEILLILSFMYVPFMREFLQTAPITGVEWLYLILCPVLIITLDELRKLIVRHQLQTKKGETR